LVVTKQTMQDRHLNDDEFLIKIKSNVGNKTCPTCALSMPNEVWPTHSRICSFRLHRALGLQWQDPSTFFFPSTLVWQDEFDYEGKLDPSKWGYDIGGFGWGNNELQYYTDRLENARVTGGRLIITARKEDYEGCHYTSARVLTKNRGDWLYGRIQVKAKLPSGRGTWPAIWLLPTDWAYGPWPRSGEIDIVEHVGFDYGVVHSAVHTDMYCHPKQTQKEATLQVPLIDQQFHIYELVWKPDSIETFFDGRKCFSYTKKQNDQWQAWPFDKRFHLLLNIAIGGNWGGMKGIDDNIWPQTMEIEYVRVYSV
jgi:beta-glucanase (GH16 family)